MQRKSRPPRRLARATGQAKAPAMVKAKAPATVKAQAHQTIFSWNGQSQSASQTHNQSQSKRQSQSQSQNVETNGPRRGVDKRPPPRFRPPSNDTFRAKKLQNPKP